MGVLVHEPVTILGRDGEPIGAFRLEDVEALDNGPGGLVVVLHSSVLTFERLAPEHWRELHALWVGVHAPLAPSGTPPERTTVMTVMTVPSVTRAPVCLDCGQVDCTVPGHEPGVERLGLVVRA